MNAFELGELFAERARSERAYLEFLRVPAMSVGLYELAAGATDPQQPHGEDEVYYVVRGRARISVADADRAVGPGSIVFVKAGLAHRFHSIDEDLAVLVFFAPAEYTLAESAPDMQKDQTSVSRISKNEPQQSEASP